MTIELEPDVVVSVPLIVDHVLIGRVVVDENDEIWFEITAPGTKSYLTEALLTKKAKGISLNIDYIEPPQNHVPTRGHLRLVKE